MECSYNRALAAASQIKLSSRLTSNKRKHHADKAIQATARASYRLAELSPHDLQAYAGQSESERGTVLYLGYGSNLSNETFRGNRGIKPISQVNVQVPSLRLTFDLPGLPYAEPCFANSGARDPENDPPRETGDVEDEKTPLLAQKLSKDKYRKDRWHKGLIGVVYEVTPEDYAHIIQTEGGGSSYHDIVVDCHPFAPGDLKAPVPQNPTLPSFKAHTLFAPASPAGEDPPKDGGRFQRPDTSYAQPSARYLKLMTDGAAELGLPYEYQDYLHALRPYTITQNKQRIGQFVLLGVWAPMIVFVFAMGRMFADDRGRLPPWLVELSGAIFKAVWASYDNFFRQTFGDGERTVTDEDASADTCETIIVSKTGMSRWRSSRDPEKLDSSDGIV